MSIYFAIFDSYLSYCCLAWAQNFSTIQKVLTLQNNAVRIINFQPRNFHTSPLFKQNSILKFQDKFCLENILLFLIHDLVFPQTNITIKPQSSTQVKLFYKTNRYGKYSITISAIALESWQQNPKATKKYAT